MNQKAQNIIDGVCKSGLSKEELYQVGMALRERSGLTEPQPAPMTVEEFVLQYVENKSFTGSHAAMLVRSAIKEWRGE